MCAAKILPAKNAVAAPSVPPADGGVVAFVAQQDRKLARFGYRSRRFVHVKVQAGHQDPPAGAKQRLPIQIGFAVDRSGSMSGEKLRLAKLALATALRQLQPADTYVVAWFDDDVNVPEPAQKATSQAIARTIALCETVECGSSTALYAGWRAAFQGIAGVLDHKAVARVLLLTDGQANVGPQSLGELVATAQEMRHAGVGTSAIGIGADFNEELLSGIAAAGDGRFYYAAKPEQIPVFVAAELGEAQEVVARKVELRARPSQGMKVELLGNLANHWNGTELCVLLGDLVSDQEIELALQVTLARVGDAAQLPLLPHGGPNPRLELTVYEAGEPALVPLQLCEWTYAGNAANDTELRNVAVDRLVAGQFAARARMKAVGLNRRGRYVEAQAELQDTAKKIAAYAHGDAELVALVALLQKEALELSVYADELRRKEMYTESSHRSRSKDMTGGSTRTRPS